MDYNKWENFYKVIKRAIIACENSGHNIACDFPEVRKIVKAGATEKSIAQIEKEQIQRLKKKAKDASLA